MSGLLCENVLHIILNCEYAYRVLVLHLDHLVLKHHEAEFTFVFSGKVFTWRPSSPNVLGAARILHPKLPLL